MSMNGKREEIYAVPCIDVKPFADILQNRKVGQDACCFFPQVAEHRCKHGGFDAFPLQCQCLILKKFPSTDPVRIADTMRR